MGTAPTLSCSTDGGTRTVRRWMQLQMQMQMQMQMQIQMQMRMYTGLEVEALAG